MKRIPLGFGFSLEFGGKEQKGSRLTAADNMRQSTASQLANLNTSDAAYNPNNDPVVIARGIGAYYEMLRDPEIASDFTQVLNLMMPGYQWKPGDSSLEAARNADFMTEALKVLPGSSLSVIRNRILGNAFISGFSVFQPELTTVELPGYGMCIVYKNLNVKPSNSFVEASPTGIIVDQQGHILGFKQGTDFGGKEIKADAAFFFSYRGNENNWWGRSGFYECYDPWIRKREIYKVYATFMNSNASGIRTIEVSEEEADDPALMADAQAVANDLAPLQSLAVDPRWKMNINIPPGTAGMHFLRMVMEQDLQIRKGMLGDSAFSGQAGSAGSHASREVSQGNVRGSLYSDGLAFCEDIAEQIAPFLLELNGFSGPAPILVPEPVHEATGDSDELEKRIATLDKLGLIPRMPETTLLELAKQALKPLGIAIDRLEERKVTPPVNTQPRQPEPQQAPEEAVQPGGSQQGEPGITAEEYEAALQLSFANAPAGRTLTDIRRRGKQADAAFESSLSDLEETWNGVLPQLMNALESALFVPGNLTWKVKNIEELDKALHDTIRYKSSEVRKSLDATKSRAWDLGEAQAKEMIPVKAVGLTLSPTKVSNANAKNLLRIRTRHEVNARYQQIEDEMYWLLENGFTGEESPVALIPRMRELLEVNGFAGRYAATIVNNAFFGSFNESRMNLFREIEDPTGQIPGSIIGYVFAAVDDHDTTPLCRGYNGRAFKSDDPSLPQPQLHHNCRSQLIPVFTGEKPWTPESSGEFLSLEESKKMSADIPDGWGKVA